jgi:hypothetical protein
MTLLLANLLLLIKFKFYYSISILIILEHNPNHGPLSIVGENCDKKLAIQNWKQKNLGLQ